MQISCRTNTGSSSLLRDQAGCGFRGMVRAHRVSCWLGKCESVVFFLGGRGEGIELECGSEGGKGFKVWV